MASISNSLEPLQREATASIIATTIRERIMDGTFAPGTQLGEVQLATGLGVSRGPVREAMQRLIQEGLLRSERHRGVFVITLDEDDIRDIYLGRNAIERVAAMRFTTSAPPGARVALEDLLKRMDAAARKRSWPAVVELDLEFHRFIVDAAGSKRLSRMFESLLAETRLCLTDLESAYQQHDEVVAEHRALLDAFSSRDAARAARCIDDHHAHAVDHLAERLRSSRPLTTGDVTDPVGAT